MSTTDPGTQWQHLTKLVRTARDLEAGGLYNASKLFWAAVFAEQIRASNVISPARPGDDLNREVADSIAALEASGAPPTLIAALRAGEQAVQENRTIPHRDIPAVHVCRVCGEIMLGERPVECPACGAHGLTLHTPNPIYFLDFLTPDQVLAALEAGPRDFQALIDGMSEDLLSRAPQPGEWSVRETLWHVLVAQRLLETRVEKLLAEHHPSLESVAAWVFAGGDTLSTDEIMAHYRDSRSKVIGQLRAMQPGDWWRTGWHEEWGTVTILSQATYFARHERSHWQQITSALRAVRGG